MMRRGAKLESYVLLADALGRLPTELPDWHLAVVGDGGARREVRAALDAHIPGRYRLLGRRDARTIRSLLPADQPVTRENCVLRWEGPAGSRYDVRVATDDLDVLAEAYGLEAGELVVPPESLADLPAGAEIVWQVHAELPDGTRLASAAFRLEIR